MGDNLLAPDIGTPPTIRRMTAAADFDRAAAMRAAGVFMAVDTLLTFDDT